MQANLKSLVRDQRLFMVGLLCLVGVVSFLLGRVSTLESVVPVDSDRHQAGVVFIDTPESVTSPAQGVTVVASKNGTRYHLLTCSGANTINEANKIYFNSIEEAKSAGYTPAGNCEF